MKLSKITVAVLSATSIQLALPAVAQTAAAEESVEVIQVSGIRGALTSALAEKREKNNLVEIIEAEDIGKLPDQNLAEVLENITGIQITRTAGVGTGVQIRGSNSNNVLINGVETVGAGTGRGGISFEDVSASIIAGVDPKVGLYASFCIAVIIAIVGGRPGMISAATGAMALVMVTLVK